MDEIPSKEKQQVKLREVNNYEDCWGVADPECILAGKKRISEIGVPIDIKMSNNPLNPVFLPEYMATLEENLEIAENYRWEGFENSIALGLTNRISEILYRMNLLKPDEDPGVKWAEKFYESIPPGLQETVNELTGGQKILYPSQNIIWRCRQKGIEDIHELYKLAQQRLKIFAEKLEISIEEGQFYVLINKLFASMRERFAQDEKSYPHSKRKTIDGLLYTDRIFIVSEHRIIPWGVLAIDDWEWKEFEKGKIDADFFVGTNYPAYEGIGDYHAGAKTKMWRFVLGQLRPDSWKEYWDENIDVPHPPNLESGYRVIIPYQENGGLKKVAVIYFNNIDRVNPKILEEARLHYTSYRGGDCSKVIFVAPDKNNKNQVWEPVFADPESTEFIMAVKPRQEVLSTVKFQDIESGFSG